MKTVHATFGAGCFWGVEEAFRKLPGVIETAVGYMGGTTKKPTYEEVCSDRTGHVEVVHVQYNPEKIHYEELLRTFWKLHDPTTPNRQGPDVGSQYRSVIFYYTTEQQEQAELSKKEEQKNHKKPIVTSIEKAQTFWKAEEYHQKYLLKRNKNTCY